MIPQENEQRVIRKIVDYVRPLVNESGIVYIRIYCHPNNVALVSRTCDALRQKYGIAAHWYERDNEQEDQPTFKAWTQTQVDAALARVADKVALFAEWDRRLEQL